MFKKLLFAGAAVAMLTTVVSSNANASDLLASIRVMLPNGTYVSLDNTPDHPWYHDQRVVTYDRYYYDPVQRVYVVYDNAHPPRWAHPRPDRVVVINHRTPPGHAYGHYKNRGHDGRNDHDDHGHGRH